MTAATTTGWTRTTIKDLKATLNAAGSHFFDRDTIKFFGTKTFHHLVWKDGTGGYLWVQSDNRNWTTVYSVRFYGSEDPRVVHTFPGVGDIDGDYFSSLFRAANLARGLVAGMAE